MAQLPADSLALTRHASGQVDAIYTKGETVYRLEAVTTQYAACSCLHSIDGNFCKHQLKALQLLYAPDSTSMVEQQQEQQQQRFRTVCVRALGTDFGCTGGCSADDISVLIDRLSREFLPRTAIVDSSSPARADAGAEELFRPSTPPHPSASARAAPPQLTPGKAFLADAARQKRALDDLYATLTDPNTDHNLRRRLGPELGAMIARSAMLIERNKAGSSNDPLCLTAMPFNVPDAPQTVHRHRSAAEPSRQAKARSATACAVTDGAAVQAQPFCRTAASQARQANKPSKALLCAA
jgi:hypothetical protein